MVLSWTSDDPRARARELAGTIAVSTICFKPELGGITMRFEREDGSSDVYRRLTEQVFTIEQFPGLVSAETGVSQVDVCQVQVPELIDRGIDGLARALSDTDSQLLTLLLDVGNVASPDPERRAAHLRENEAWIDAAARLGAPFVRIIPGAAGGAANHDRGAQLESLTHLVDYAGDAGVCLVLENHGGDSLDPSWMVETLEEVGRDRLGMILDIGNAEPMLSAGRMRAEGEAMDGGSLDLEPLYAMVEQLAPYATQVHAKTHEVSSDGTCGPIDLGRALEIVKAAGFAGPVTIEYEGDRHGERKWEAIRRSIETVREYV